MELTIDNNYSFIMYLVGYQFPELEDVEYDSNWLNVQIALSHQRDKWSSNVGTPFIFGCWRSGDREVGMLSKRFPFGIYYEVEDEVIYVYAILDLRRDSLWIRKSLRARR